MRRGVLIAIEGINGSGKSSIIRDVALQIRSRGYLVRIYKFPNRNGIHGERIDKFLKGETAITSKYDILNMFAEDRWAMRDSIINDLNRGYIVLCDRYIASAIAYHIPLGASDFMITNYVNIIGYFDADMILPDKTYLIDGYHLSLRQEDPQKYHYQQDKARQLFQIFKKIIHKCSLKNETIRNVHGDMKAVVNRIVEDIMDPICNHGVYHRQYKD